MKYDNLDNWDKNFRHDGLLYFAQRINEMLFYYTDHIFKSPVLNTELLVNEYIKTAKLARNNDGHLKQIMDEFQNAFKKDIILNGHIDEHERTHILHKLNTSSSEEQFKIMEYVLYVLGDYNKWCKQFIKEIVHQENEKKKIEIALRCYISGLIAAGYSHEFIYYYNREVFFKKVVNSMDSLDFFINRFDFKERTYKVYIAIDAKAVNFFKELLEQRLKVNFASFEHLTDLKYDKTKYRLVMVNISAFDEQSAAWKAYNRLNIFFRYYRFLAEQKDSWFFYKARVADENDVVAYVNLKDYGIDYPKEDDTEFLVKYSDICISVLQTKEPYFMINKALTAHNAAIDDLDIKNRFLNLWSILEILFVWEQNDTKLSEIIKKAVPILQHTYLHSLFAIIKKDISTAVDKNLISEIINSIDEADISNGMTYIIALEKYEDQRKKICAELKDYPLLRNRIFKLNELCRDKKQLLDNINAYAQRITWHFTRLYRTRNAIIHLGSNPDYLRELVEHLHSYSDECLSMLIFLLAKKPQLETISNAIIHVQFRVEKIITRLKSKETEAVSKDDIDYFLDF